MNVQRYFANYSWVGGIVAGMLVAVLCFVCREESPILWDSGSFALAAQSYDIAQDRPHLPGYFLHVVLLDIVRILCSATLAGVMVSVVWAVVAVMIVYRILLRHCSAPTAFVITLLFATNPMMLFFGSISETYTFDAFLGVALFACFPSRSNSVLSSTLFSLPLMAFALGYRATSPLLLTPLVIVLWWKEYQSIERRIFWRRLWGSLCIAFVILLLWLIPMMLQCGGVAAYIKLYSTHNPTMSSTIIQNLVVMCSYGLYSAVVPIGLWLFGRMKVTMPKAIRFPVMQLLVWLWIPLVLFVFGFYGKGYALLCLPAVYILLLPVVEQRVYAAIIGVCIQLAMFLGMPYHIPDAAIAMKGGNALLKSMERAATVYSLSRSHIATLNSILHESDTLLAGYSDKIIVVDPSFPIPARALQVRYPNYRFAVLLVRDGGTFQLHSGIDIAIHPQPEIVLHDAVILSTPSMTSHYPPSVLRAIDSSFHSRLYRVADATKLYEFYLATFVR